MCYDYTQTLPDIRRAGTINVSAKSSLPLESRFLFTQIGVITAFCQKYNIPYMSIVKILLFRINDRNSQFKIGLSPISKSFRKTS